MSHMFDIRHCTVILYPARSCNPYVKLPVEISFFMFNCSQAEDNTFK